MTGMHRFCDLVITHRTSSNDILFLWNPILGGVRFVYTLASGLDLHNNLIVQRRQQTSEHLEMDPILFLMVHRDTQAYIRTPPSPRTHHAPLRRIRAISAPVSPKRTLAPKGRVFQKWTGCTRTESLFRHSQALQQAHLLSKIK